MKHEEFLKLKVGDKVKLIDERGANWNLQGFMDCFCGQVVTISSFAKGDCFEIEEDNREQSADRGIFAKKWWFNERDIVCKVDGDIEEPSEDGVKEEDAAETNAEQMAPYKARFIIEYRETKDRYEKLKAFNTRIEAAKASTFDGQFLKAPKHDCPSNLLRDQQRVMGEYLHILELRAVFEEIEL